MSSEKPIIKIVVGVTTAVLSAGALYLCRNWVLPILSWCRGVAVSVWDWITFSHSVPGWLIILLSMTALWCSVEIILAVNAARKPQKPRPLRDSDWPQFLEVEFMGVLWRWSYTGSGDILRLHSFCPQSGCDMQTWGRLGAYYGMGTETTVYQCDRCGHKPELQGTQEQVEDKAIREIQRLLRSGDWKRHVERTRNV